MIQMNKKLPEEGFLDLNMETLVLLGQEPQSKLFEIREQQCDLDRANIMLKIQRRYQSSKFLSNLSENRS
jgi:hypothetical protein